jgi:hypothetical protein
MKRSFFSALAALVFGALMVVPTVPASAQVRIGASVRISDNVFLRVGLGRHGYVRVIPYDSRYAHRAWLRARQLRHRARSHQQWLREIEREHKRLHRAMRLGYVNAWQHRAWHEAVGFDHRDFLRGLEERSRRTQRRVAPPRTRPAPRRRR